MKKNSNTCRIIINGVQNRTQKLGPIGFVFHEKV